MTGRSAGRGGGAGVALRDGGAGAAGAAVAAGAGVASAGAGAGLGQAGQAPYGRMPAAQTLPGQAPPRPSRKLLLHVCCGPCAIYPVRALAAEGEYAVSGLFYNPNIHPADEHARRMEGAKALFAAEGLPLAIAGGCEQGAWEARARMGEDERCETCYRARLSAVARAAAERGFDAFSTTLLISPYQRHGLIRAICEELSEGSRVAFLYRDFRPFFREGQRLARDAGIYRQKYCGCILSLRDRAAQSAGSTGGATKGKTRDSGSAEEMAT